MSLLFKVSFCFSNSKFILKQIIIEPNPLVFFEDGDGDSIGLGRWSKALANNQPIPWVYKNGKYSLKMILVSFLLIGFIKLLIYI